MAENCIDPDRFHFRQSLLYSLKCLSMLYFTEWNSTDQNLYLPGYNNFIAIIITDWYKKLQKRVIFGAFWGIILNIKSNEKWLCNTKII